jgi:hypothetical protein
VVANTPAAGGGTRAVTRGELLDNENFGNLVNSVFTAAGGKPSGPAALGKMSTPGNLFNGASAGYWQPTNTGIDITKMSEAERIAFLNQVAQFASDGTMSLEERGVLQNMAAGYSRDGENEPAAVTINNSTGKPTAINKDDLMENGTFEKQLNSMTSPFGFPFADNSPDTKALRDAIATANYDELGYEERVALVQAFDAAKSDHKIDAKEAAGLKQMLEALQKPSGSGSADNTGTTLSNGLVVSEDDVEKPGNFMSMVNSVLDRSGVTTATTNPYNGTTNYGYNGFSNNQSTVPQLRSLDVKGLTAEQRIEVLQMISQAGSDRDVTQAEVDAIKTRVNVMLGNESRSLPMVSYSIG